MDFSKFLHSGELSDITVVVDSKTYDLHKFPICIKSDFFRTHALNSPAADRDNVALDDFPGGSETFQQVVDYCYNVHFDTDADNVCQLRCAAEVLQMTGPGNLAGVTDGFLQETLSSVRAGRKLETVLEMIRRCRRLGTVAEQAGVVGKCIGAIVDTWLVTPMFSRHLSKSSVPSVDTELLLRLCILPFNWFSDLLSLAKERRVAETVRAALIQLYVSKALNIEKDRDKTKKERDEEREDGRKEEKQRSKQEDKNSKKTMMGNRHLMEDEDDDDEEEEEEDGEGSDKAEEDSNHDEENEGDNVEESEKKMTANQLSSAIDKRNSEEFEERQCKAMDDEEIAAVIDALLYENSEEMLSLLGELVSPKWTLAVLDRAIALGCKAQEPLIRLASRHLDRFAADDLEQVLPDTYLMILQDVCRNDEDLITPDEICRSVDSFLQCLSSQGTLTPDIFRRILETLPEKYRTNEDTLFHALNKLLQSDETDLGEDERQSLLESIDLGRLSEVALNAAFSAKLVPVEHVARAALLLSSRLRADLDAAQSVVRMQQDELCALRGEGHRRTHSPWTTTSDCHGITRSLGTDFNRESLLSTTKTSYHRSAPWSKSYGTGTGSASYAFADSGSYGYRSSVVPSLASDLELQLALSSLGDIAAHDLHYYGGGGGGGGRQIPLPLGNRDSRFPDPPAYDDADYYRPNYRPLPSGQAYKRYSAAKHYR